jgi:prepilin-type N-terminal cleavage/methylation domain-containing protein
VYRIHRRRSAVTLVEMLVVIAIIALLASLLIGAVVAVLRTGSNVRNRNDILQLSGALQEFYKRYKFYPPDKIRLYSNLNSYNSADPLDAASISYLNTMWPDLDRTQTFNWGGGASLPAGGVVLEGDQCLVFFLGGLPSGAFQAPNGFFNNPKNPTAPAGTSTDRAKFFAFESARCVNLHPDNIFPSYLDAHAVDNDNVTKKKRPFLYFSAGKRPDGYVNSNALFAVAPYFQSAGPPIKFHNSTSYQLISAGPDGEFGPGGLWTPGGATHALAQDNISNFHDAKLGS